MSLRLLMLLVFLYSSDLHLKLTNPTCFIALRASAVYILLARRHHAFGVLAGTPTFAKASCRAFRASETALTVSVNAILS